MSCLLQAHHAAVSKTHGTTVRLSCQQQCRQALEMGKVADDHNVIVIDLQKIRSDHGVAVGIEFVGMAWTGGRSNGAGQEMRGLFGSRLAAVLDERHRDAVRCKELGDPDDFLAPFIAQSAIGVFTGRFRFPY